MIFYSYQTLLFSLWTTTLTYTLYSLHYTEIVHNVSSHHVFLLPTYYIHVVLYYLLNVNVIDV